MTYRDFEITQNGKDLSTSDKIIINKYDNKTSRLHFTFEDSLEGNFYVAMNNPVLNRYFISPIVDGYYEITSEISVYPGRWTMVVIVTDDSYEITDDTVDQSKAVYVSNEFSKVIVKDNFLDEESKDAIDPVQNAAIDSALESLESARNTLVTMAQNAADAANEVAVSESNVTTMYNSVRSMYNEIVAMYNQMRTWYSDIRNRIGG